MVEKESEVYSQPCETSKMERFAKIVHGWKQLTVLAKCAIIDVWQGFEYASDTLSLMFDRKVIL